MSKALKPEPIPPKPRPDTDRGDILARINTRFEKMLRYLGK